MDNFTLKSVESLIHNIDSYFELNDITLKGSYILSETENNTFKVTRKNSIEPTERVYSSDYNLCIGKRLGDKYEVKKLVDKIVTSTMTHSELDLCYIEDSLGNCNIFQIHGYGASFSPILLSNQLLLKVKESEYMLDTDLERIHADESMIKNYIPDKEPRELSDNLGLLKRRYTYRAGSFAFSSTKVAKKLIFPSYCKFYMRLGYCSNPNCKKTHDPRTKSFCKHLARIGRCDQPNCKLSHELNEYIASDEISNQHDTSNYNFISQAPLAKKQSVDNYPICRPFAYLGYCFRGSACKFRHSHLCPEFYSYGVCNAPKCPLKHLRSEVTITSLQNIPMEDYLLPPLQESEGVLDHGRWFGLFERKKCLEDRVKGAVSVRNDFNRIQVTTSSEEENEDVEYTSDVASDESWAQIIEINDKNLSLDDDYIPIE